MASPAASTTGGGTVVSPTDNWEDISTTGTLACPNLMNALPTVPIQVAFESDLQDMAESINNNALEESHGAHDLRDVQRNSFSRKERNALVHLNIFLRDHFQAYNKETFNRKFCKAEDLVFDPKRADEAKWWDDMIGQFFYYLGYKAVNRTKPSLGRIKYETATGYASSVKSYYENQFRSHFESIPVFQTTKWKKLRARLLGAYHEACRKDGTKLTNPHIASTGRDREALAMGCIWDASPLGAEFFHLNNSMSHCVGRGSEVALIRVPHMSLCTVNELSTQYDVLSCSLKKDKQGTEQDLCIYPHRDALYEDYYFSLIYLIIMNNMSSTGNNEFMFPTFAAKASVESNDQGDSKVSEYWTTVFQTMCVILERVGMNINKLTSHHGKKGSSQKMSEIPGVSGLAQIFRAGWVVRGIHSLFDYVVGSRPLLQAAGKALSNWTCKLGDVIAGGQPPNLADISTAREKLDAFVEAIFGDDEDEQWSTPIRWVLTATLLRHYNDFCDIVASHPEGKFTNVHNHLLVSRIDTCLQRSGVTQAEFDAWKQEVNQGFFSRNAVALPIENFPRHLLDQRYPMSSIVMDPRTFVDHFNTLAHCYHSLHGTLQLVMTGVTHLQAEITQLRMEVVSARPTSQWVVPGEDDDAEVDNDDSLVHVAKYTVARGGWGKCGSISDLFFHFFDSNAAKGYELDLRDPSWNSRKDKEGIKQKFGRLKKTVKFMLYFCDSYPDAQPRDVLSYASWKRNMREMSVAAEKRISALLFPTYVPVHCK